LLPLFGGRARVVVETGRRFAALEGVIEETCKSPRGVIFEPLFGFSPRFL
jgi:hypothetical protein